MGDKYKSMIILEYLNIIVAISILCLVIWAVISANCCSLKKKLPDIPECYNTNVHKYPVSMTEYDCSNCCYEATCDKDNL